MTDYAVVFEQASDGSWSARAADLPVYAVGDTREEAADRIERAIALHLESLPEADRNSVSRSSQGGTVTV